MPTRAQAVARRPGKAGGGRAPVSAALALLLVATAVPAGAQAPDTPAPSTLPAEVPPAAAKENVSGRLQTVEEQLRASRSREKNLRAQEDALAEEEEQLRKLLIEAAEQAQAQEASLSQLEGNVAALADEEARKVEALALGREQLAALLSALSRLARLPPHAALAGADSAADTLRAAMLLKTAIPALEAKADKLQAELTGLQRLREQLADRRGETDRTARSLAEERERLQALLAHKGRLLRETAEERRGLTERLGRLSSEARDVRELIERIEGARRQEQARREQAERRKPGGRVPQEQQAALPPAEGADTGAEASRADAATGADAPVRRKVALPAPVNLPLDRDSSQIRRFPGRSRSLTPPVAGRLTRNFGESTGAAAESQGAELETREGAQVVAPFDGRVMFAGPFRGYGQILIIEHAGGYHTMLAGLERIDAAVGMVLLAGEPVGVMGGGAGPEGPRLYMELRRGGRPIDPMPWLAERRGKVSG